MEIDPRDDSSQQSADAERPDPGGTQPYPEKNETEAVVDDTKREATRRYVERVDRYLARPDVQRAGSHAAPSFSGAR